MILERTGVVETPTGLEGRIPFPVGPPGPITGDRRRRVRVPSAVCPGVDRFDRPAGGLKAFGVHDEPHSGPFVD